MLSRAEILRFYLPLVLTSQMMTLSVPLINLGLGRAGNATVALAAYAVGHSVAIVLNAVVLSARHTTAGLVTGPRSYRSVARFTRSVAVLATGVEIILGTTPVGTLVLEGLVGAPPEVAAQARLVLVLQAPIPLLLAERGIYQGIALMARQTVLITFSTLVRLATLTAVVLILALALRVPGAAAGALSLTAGVGIEALMIRLTVRRRLRALTVADRTRTADDRDVSAREIGRFALPLMVNHAVWALQRPLINSFVSRLEDPLTALAAYGVVQPLLLFTGSPLWGLTSTVQVLPLP